MGSALLEAQYSAAKDVFDSPLILIFSSSAVTDLSPNNIADPRLKSVQKVPRHRQNSEDNHGYARVALCRCMRDSMLIIFSFFFLIL